MKTANALEITLIVRHEHTARLAPIRQARQTPSEPTWPRETRVDAATLSGPEPGDDVISRRVRRA